ncbi:acyltransferase family protein [Microbacterium sp. NPDC089695]|uniref:acyltransferase family protein n=1 Tax=Microbacterium sp. NPDC089695 TaxID=3364198 RepID=UPI003800933E
MVSALVSDARTPRLDSLTSLRWWAALAVFFFHIRNVVPLPAPLGEIAGYGNFGVAFFFILSGFVLTWSWRPTIGIGTFYWRRFARIYPLHVVTLIIAIPVFYSLSPDPAQTWVKPFDVAVLVLCLLLLQGWSRDPAVLFAGNPAAWTLTAEMFFYAMHPFITRVLRLLSSRGALWTAIGVLALSLVARTVMVVDPGGWLAGLPWPILRINEFIIGMCLAWAIRLGWRPRVPVWVPVALLAAFLLGLQVLERVPRLEFVLFLATSYVSEIMTALFALLICAFAAADLAGRTRVSRLRPLVALGEWSYAFYLIHATLIYIVLGALGPQHGWAGVAWILLLLAASIVLAWALHVLVERPVERRLRSWQNGIVARRASTAAAPHPKTRESEKK